MTSARDWTLPEDDRHPDDPGLTKAAVMAELARLVAEGRATMTTLEAGTLEVRLPTGELFHLGEDTTTRIV